MGSLYQIDNSIAELLEHGFNETCINTETGEIDFEQGQIFLDQLQLDRKQKLENIALYIKNLESEAEAIKQEEKNLKARRDAKERKVDNLKEYLKQSMLNFNETKFETARVALSFRTSKLVEIVDFEKLGETYLIEKVEKVADKKAIKQALENGIEVDGACIRENRNLQIK